MKLYIAARFNSWKDEMPRLKELLESRGHTLTKDWSVHSDVRPYDAHQEEARRQVTEDVQGVDDADVVVILADNADGGAGMYVELGVAIERWQKTGSPKIFVVGKDNARSAFYFHPSVTRVSTFEEVLDQL